MNVVTQFPAVRDYGRDLRFQAMFEGAAVGIGICQLDGRIVEANPALGRMLGYSPEELAGAQAGALFPEARRRLFMEVGRGIPPANSSSGNQPADNLASGNLASGNSPPDERWLGELIGGEREGFEMEKRCRRKDGTEFWGHLTVSLGRGTRREPAFLIAVIADATERKREEEHLREAEKMEVIGRLAGGIAHDFNNLLTGILLYCDLLSAGLQSGGPEEGGFGSGGLANGGLASGGWERNELRQHVEEVRMAGEQGAALTQQLLAIARKQAAEPRPISIGEVVASTENLLRRLIGEQIELVTALDSGAGQVLADPAQVRQILLNLVLNARDALPQGGKIWLSARAAKFPANAEAGRARRAVSLAVKDNGIGMDAETRARLFVPFFTTKKPGEGTGLGLATVARIAGELGGTIEVESEPGRGATIAVFLPALEAATAVAASAATAEAPRQQTTSPVARPFADEIVHSVRSKTILLVDDHAATRKSMQRVLVNAGYKILPTASGEQAQKVFAEHSAAVDLLIADCMMPGMTGQELADTLQHQKPGLKVLLLSGYQQAPAGHAAGGLIRKPFSGKALLERVAGVLHGP
jgi:signal transduction histidine kinase/CheY-like chemotaxis protein